MAEEIKPGVVSQVLKLVGLVFLSIFTFIGLVYFLRSNVWLSALIAITVLIAAAVLSGYLVVYKTKERNTKSLSPEYIFIILYAIVAIASAPFIFHASNIELVSKSAIKKAGADKIQTITDLKNQYAKAIKEKTNELNTNVETNLTNYFNSPAGNRQQYKTALEDLLVKGESIERSVSFRNYETNPTEQARNTIRSEIERLRSQRETRMKSGYNLGTVNVESETYSLIARKIFDKWRFLDISHYYYDIDNMFSKVYATAQGKMPDFTYEKSNLPELKLDSPMNSVTNSSLKAILAALGTLIFLHLLILAPYLSVKRYQESIVASRNQYQSEGSIRDQIAG